MALKKLFSRKTKPLSSVSSNNMDNVNGHLDCNICLDFVRDPVVTLCGHLYCWPCIYEWFHVQSTTLAPNEHPQCPVCKADISQTTLVPLYGRGETVTHSRDNQAAKATSIPPRPPAHGTRALVSATSRPTQQLPLHNRYQNVHYPSSEPGIQASSSPFGQARNPSINVVHPVLEMFTEMIYAPMFRNSSRNLYPVQNSYHHAMNPWLRRQEIQANMFLSRISLFFLCCILLCLVLF